MVTQVTPVAMPDVVDATGRLQCRKHKIAGWLLVGLSAGDYHNGLACSTLEEAK